MKRFGFFSFEHRRSFKGFRRSNNGLSIIIMVGGHLGMAISSGIQAYYDIALYDGLNWLSLGIGLGMLLLFLLAFLGCMWMNFDRESFIKESVARSFSAGPS